MWGDGSTVRDFIHISDVVTAITLACSYKSEHTVFNIGSGTGCSLNGLIDLIQGLLDYPLSVIYKNSRGCDVPTNVLSIDRAKSHLEWIPKLTIEEGVRSYFDYLKSPNE